jgi:hypothetical protein
MTKEPGRRLSGAAALAGRQNAELVALALGAFIYLKVWSATR